MDVRESKVPPVEIERFDKVGTLHVKITPEDFNERGLVKGELVYKIWSNSKQPLSRIIDALNQHELQFSMKEFIRSAIQDGKLGAWSLKKKIVEAMKLVYPQLMGKPKWQLIHQQIKREIAKAVEERS